MSDNNNIVETINRYESYINNVLKEDLRQIDLKLQKINAELTDLIQQKHTLKIITDKNKHPDGFKTQVNLGCNFFMEASVEDTAKLIMNIGLNHYLEFSSAEATKYLQIRIDAYEKKAEALRNQSAETKAHIKLLLFGIGELQNSKNEK